MRRYSFFGRVFGSRNHTSSRRITHYRPIHGARFSIEQLEDRRLLTASRTANMLGQEIPLGSWLSDEDVAVVQQLAAHITTTGDSNPIYELSTAQSFPLILLSKVG